MKFKRKWLALLSSPLPLASIVALNVSAETDTPNQPATPPADGEGEAEGTPLSSATDEQLTEFRNEMKKFITAKLGEIIDSTIKNLEEEANSLSRADDDKLDVQDIAKALYYRQVVDFLRKNKEYIIRNPQRYGFSLIYPNILLNNKDFKTVNVANGDNVFENVTVPANTNNETNPYRAHDPGLKVEALEPREPAEGEEAPKPRTLESTKQDIQNYMDNFQGELSTILAENGVPTVTGENANSALIYPSANGTSTIQLRIPAPYDSWAKYIEALLRKETTKFDLNQNSVKPEEKTKPEIPPINPDQPSTDPLEDAATIREQVANLRPELKWEYTNEYVNRNQEFISSIGSNLTQEQSDQYFFFNNPINTRFKYQVVSLELPEGANKVTAKVRLYDTVDSKQSREYTADLLVRSNINHTFANEIAIESIRETYKEFYDALGVGSDINLRKLANNVLSTRVYDLIFAAVRLQAQPAYKNALDNLIVNSGLVANSNPSPSSINRFKQTIKEFFVKNLYDIKLKDNASITKYYAELPQAYLDVYVKFNDGFKDRKAKGELNLAANIRFLNQALQQKMSENTVWEANNALYNNIITLQAIPNAADLSYLDVFNISNQLISIIQKSFVNLATLINSETINTNDVNTKGKDFVAAYNALSTESFNGTAYKTKIQKILAITSASIFLAAAMILSIVSVALYRTNGKYRKNKNKFMLVSAALVIIPIIISIIFFVIGFGGNLW
ncbi:MSC_0620 family F1-like ATPase-associated subunit [Mycoplasma corogypsi]|uniref:MSC_0620 family F1-like ATPase-associated subunit n=1 Tax=Mycoplasma corogypsi TaxID=2106 RepID=UPI0038732136